MQFQKKKKKKRNVEYLGLCQYCYTFLRSFVKGFSRQPWLVCYPFHLGNWKLQKPSCILHIQVLMLLVHILDLTFYNSLLNYYTSLLTTDILWFCQHPVWGCQVCQIREFFVIFCSFLNSRNRSERLSGRQTNNRAEIHVRAKALVLCWSSLKYLYKCMSLQLSCCINVCVIVYVR